MSKLKNATWNNELFLLGFQNLDGFKYPAFFLFLCVFMMTISGNLLTIFLASTSAQLNSPMYFFLSHLSMTDVLVTLSTAPPILGNILEEGISIPYGGCIIQMFFFCLPEEVQCLLLALMSYDRYLAICSPLHYYLIMNRRFRYNLISYTWGFGVITILIPMIQMYYLKFCGQPVYIDHIFCNTIEVMAMSCSDISILKLENTVMSIFVTGGSLLLIIATYARILVTIFRIPNSSGRQKAFSTCSSHILVVSLYYGSLIAVYDVPSDQNSSEINSGLSLLYCLFTPLMNPIIYSLRSQEVRSAFRRFMEKY